VLCRELFQRSNSSTAVHKPAHHPGHVSRDRPGRLPPDGSQYGIERWSIDELLPFDQLSTE
jgi:hypothetical protein